MMQIGVIGAGNHSRHNHGPALDQYRSEYSGSVELAAICDLDREKAEQFAAAFGFTRTYTDIDRMFDTESLDAVVAITPVSATRELVGNLLAREVPVLFEKPPGQNNREARELRDIAGTYDTPHMISFNRRFNPAVRRAREWLDTTTNSRPPSLAIARLLRTARYESEHITSTGIHSVDTVCSFLGTPERISSQRWQSRSEGGESCTARVRFANDATAQFAIMPDAGTREETYELVGPGYSIHIDALAGRLRIHDDGEQVVSWTIDDEMPRYVRNGTMAETAAFLDAVERGSGFAPTLTEGVTSLMVAEALDAGGERTIMDSRSNE